MTATAVPVLRPRSIGQLGRTYLAFAILGATQEWAQASLLLARALFLTVLLFIFWRLWTTVLGDGTLGQFTAVDLIWYLALTEIVALSLPQVHLRIESDLRTGKLAVGLIQPVSFIATIVAEALGSLGMRAVAVAGTAVPLAILFTGGLPADPSGLWVVAILLPFGLLLGLLNVVAIGLTAAWLHDVSPLYWMWQKGLFVLGGLMLPLSLYPAIAIDIAKWSPFGAMLYAPAQMAFGFDTDAALLGAVQLAAWIAVTTLVVAWLWSRLLRSLDGAGG